MSSLRVMGIILLLVSSLPDAQSQPGTTNVLSPLSYNRVGSEFWASGGAGVAEKDLNAAALNNPAGMSFSAFRITAEGIWKPRVTWLSDIHYNDLDILPSYISAGIPLGDLAVELGYCSPYGAKYGIDIPVTTEDNPDGTGEIMTIGETTRMHTGFGSVRWQTTEKLSLGFTVGVDFVQHEPTINVTVKESGLKMRIIGGMQYQWSDNFVLGLVATIPYSHNYSLQYEYPGVLAPPSNPNAQRGLTYYAIAPATIQVKSPLTLEAGTSLHISQKVEILASAEYQNWTEVYNGMNDVLQFHIGLAANLSPRLTVRLGYFTDRYPEVTAQDYFNEYFLTAGMTLRLTEKLSLTFMGLSSEPFARQHAYSGYSSPDESFYQNAFSTGFSISF